MIFILQALFDVDEVYTLEERTERKEMGEEALVGKKKTKKKKKSKVCNGMKSTDPNNYDTESCHGVKGAASCDFPRHKNEIVSAESGIHGTHAPSDNGSMIAPQVNSKWSAIPKSGTACLPSNTQNPGASSDMTQAKASDLSTCTSSMLKDCNSKANQNASDLSLDTAVDENSVRTTDAIRITSRSEKWNDTQNEILSDCGSDVAEDEASVPSANALNVALQSSEFLGGRQPNSGHGEDSLIVERSDLNQQISVQQVVFSDAKDIEETSHGRIDLLEAELKDVNSLSDVDEGGDLSKARLSLFGIFESLSENDRVAVNAGATTTPRKESPVKLCKGLDQDKDRDKEASVTEKSEERQEGNSRVFKGPDVTYVLQCKERGIQQISTSDDKSSCSSNKNVRQFGNFEGEIEALQNIDREDSLIAPNDFLSGVKAEDKTSVEKRERQGDKPFSTGSGVLRRFCDHGYSMKHLETDDQRGQQNTVERQVQREAITHSEDETATLASDANDRAVTCTSPVDLRMDGSRTKDPFGHGIGFGQQASDDAAVKNHLKIEIKRSGNVRQEATENIASRKSDAGDLQVEENRLHNSNRLSMRSRESDVEHSETNMERNTNEIECDRLLEEKSVCSAPLLVKSQDLLAKRITSGTLEVERDFAHSKQKRGNKNLSRTFLVAEIPDTEIFRGRNKTAEIATDVIQPNVAGAFQSEGNDPTDTQDTIFVSPERESISPTVGRTDSGLLARADETDSTFQFVLVKTTEKAMKDSFEHISPDQGSNAIEELKSVTRDSLRPDEEKGISSSVISGPFDLLSEDSVKKFEVVSAHKQAAVVRISEAWAKAGTKSTVEHCSVEPIPEPVDQDIRTEKEEGVPLGNDKPEQVLKKARQVASHERLTEELKSGVPGNEKEDGEISSSEDKSPDIQGSKQKEREEGELSSSESEMETDRKTGRDKPEATNGLHNERLKDNPMVIKKNVSPSSRNSAVGVCRTFGDGFKAVDRASGTNRASSLGNIDLRLKLREPEAKQPSSSSGRSAGESEKAHSRGRRGSRKAERKQTEHAADKRSYGGSGKLSRDSRDRFSAAGSSYETRKVTKNASAEDTSDMKKKESRIHSQAGSSGEGKQGIQNRGSIVEGMTKHIKPDLQDKASAAACRSSRSGEEKADEQVMGIMKHVKPDLQDKASAAASRSSRNGEKKAIEQDTKSIDNTAKNAKTTRALQNDDNKPASCGTKKEEERSKSSHGESCSSERKDEKKIKESRGEAVKDAKKLQALKNYPGGKEGQVPISSETKQKAKALRRHLEDEVTNRRRESEYCGQGETHRSDNSARVCDQSKALRRANHSNVTTNRTEKNVGDIKVCKMSDELKPRAGSETQEKAKQDHLRSRCEGTQESKEMKALQGVHTVKGGHDHLEDKKTGTKRKPHSDSRSPKNSVVPRIRSHDETQTSKPVARTEENKSTQQSSCTKSLQNRITRKANISGSGRKTDTRRESIRQQSTKGKVVSSRSETRGNKSPSAVFSPIDNNDNKSKRREASSQKTCGKIKEKQTDKDSRPRANLRGQTRECISPIKKNDDVDRKARRNASRSVLGNILPRKVPDRPSDIRGFKGKVVSGKSASREKIPDHKNSSISKGLSGKRPRSHDEVEGKLCKRLRLHEPTKGSYQSAKVGSKKEIENIVVKNDEVTSSSKPDFEPNFSVKENVSVCEQNESHRVEHDSAAGNPRDKTPAVVESGQPRRILIGRDKRLVFKRRHVNQLFIRGDNVVLIAYAK